jgi:hypothetical protein
MEGRVVSLGVFGIFVWVVVFAGGVLLDSEPYRNELLGKPQPKPAAVTAAVTDGATNAVRLQDASIMNVGLTASPRAQAVAATLPATPSSAGEEPLPPVSAESRANASENQALWFGHPLQTFAAATTLYAPLNAVILALLSALAGGCASWLLHKDDKCPASATPQEKEAFEEQLRIWKENPLGAMLRGFAVYLAVIAGVYVAGGDPFSTDAKQAMRADQYVRFAGTVSLLSFVVGYDPTRLRSLIDSVPGLGKK